MPAWRDYPLRALIEELVPGLPVTMRMDGLCITLAEHWIGAARGYDNVMGMVVSTGIGGGLILGGQTVPGPTGNAGHIGHVEVAGFDDDCPCGGRGCVEAIASGPRTVLWARTEGFEGSTGEELGAAYAAGDEVAVRAVRRAGHAIGQAIASATSLVDLELVAIGGGFSHVTPDLFDFIREPIAARVAVRFRHQGAGRAVGALGRRPAHRRRGPHPPRGARPRPRAIPTTSSSTNRGRARTAAAGSVSATTTSRNHSGAVQSPVAS